MNTNASASESIRDKIRKLLAIASCDGASEAEQATALHQAARLSEKHAIDLDALGSDASDFNDVKLCDFGERTPGWVVPVLMVLEAHFNVRCFRKRDPRSRYIGRYVSWHAFGCRPSREIAVYVYTYLRREFLRIAREMKPAQRASFFKCLALGLISRLNELLKKVPVADAAAMIHITDRLTAEFSAVSANFGKGTPVRLTPNRAAFRRGREIEINPALRGTERKAIEE